MTYIDEGEVVVRASTYSNDLIHGSGERHEHLVIGVIKQAIGKSYTEGGNGGD
jgi:hypothetical protein